MPDLNAWGKMIDTQITGLPFEGRFILYMGHVKLDTGTFEILREQELDVDIKDRYCTIKQDVDLLGPDGTYAHKFDITWLHRKIWLNPNEFFWYSNNKDDITRFLLKYQQQTLEEARQTLEEAQKCFEVLEKSSLEETDKTPKGLFSGNTWRQTGVGLWVR